MKSEDYALKLKQEYIECMNPYNETKHLEYLKNIISFKNWCSHTYNDGTKAITKGIDPETSEIWSQCELCKLNFNLQENTNIY